MKQLIHVEMTETDIRHFRNLTKLNLTVLGTQGLAWLFWLEGTDAASGLAPQTRDMLNHAYPVFVWATGVWALLSAYFEMHRQA